MDLEVSETERKQLEYATQFFEFTPDACVDSITAPPMDIISDNLKAVKAKCFKEFAGKVTEQELEASFTVISDQYNGHTNEILEKFGRYIKKNILYVKKHIVLPEDRIHLKVDEKFDGSKLEDGIQNFDNLRQKVRSAKYKKAVLEAKLANLQRVAETQEKVMKKAQMLDGEKTALVAIFDQQNEILEKQLSVIKPLMEQVENNVAVVKQKMPAKRKFEKENQVLAKQLKLDDDDNN